MKKEEVIARYGEDAYEKMLAQSNVYNKVHRVEVKARNKRYQTDHSEQAIANDREACRKGGRRYEKRLTYNRIGIQGDKNKIRAKHRDLYKPYKDIVAPNSEIHHCWQNDGTAAYSCVALVEADQHRHGIIDVIQILDGKITLLTEEEIRNGGGK